MGDRERSDAGTFVETVTPAAIRGVFEDVRGPVITSSDVAEQLDCTTEAARQKLAKLHEQGEVAKRKTGRTVVWWPAERSEAADPPDEPRVESDDDGETDDAETDQSDDGADETVIREEEPTLDPALVERVRKEL